MSDRSDDFRGLPRLGDLTVADLDGEIPIFPLAGALLLPSGRMPLNIFEPRYLAMVDDALRGRRLIGMIQPQGDPSDDESDDDLEADPDDDDQDENWARLSERTSGVGAGGIMTLSSQAPAIYQIGCAGRLVSYLEREDGTCAITLAGVARFRVRRELDMSRGYRRVLADFAPFAGDLKEGGPITFDRDSLIEALRRYFVHRGFEARWEAIEQMDDETLIITLSMICPFPAAEKQALLEAPTVAERARTLLALLHMAGHEPNDGGRKTHAV